MCDFVALTRCCKLISFLYLILCKIESCNNSIMNFLFEVFGKYDLQILLTKYDITGLCSPRRFRLLACNYSCFLRL